MSATPAQAASRELSGFGGGLIGPDDPGYEEGRRVWNAIIDKRPAAILRCRTAVDVIAAVNFAREQGLPLAVRGGGPLRVGRGQRWRCGSSPRPKGLLTS